MSNEAVLKIQVGGSVGNATATAGGPASAEAAAASHTRTWGDMFKDVLKGVVAGSSSNGGALAGGAAGGMMGGLKGAGGKANVALAIFEKAGEFINAAIQKINDSTNRLADVSPAIMGARANNEIATFSTRRALDSAYGDQFASAEAAKNRLELAQERLDTAAAAKAAWVKEKTDNMQAAVLEKLADAMGIAKGGSTKDALDTFLDDIEREVKKSKDSLNRSNSHLLRAPVNPFGEQYLLSQIMQGNRNQGF